MKDCLRKRVREPLLFITPQISLWGQGESGEPQGGKSVSVKVWEVLLSCFLLASSVNVRKYFPFIPLLCAAVSKNECAAYFYILKFIIFLLLVSLKGFKSYTLNLWLVTLFIGHVLYNGLVSCVCMCTLTL